MIATGIPDMAAKIYMADNYTFADAFNYAIFDGEPVIKPNQLSTKEEASVLKIWNQNIGEKIIQDQYMNRVRDILKECVIKETEELVYVYMGIENQKYIHYAMPVRVMLYDVLDYAKQVDEVSSKHRTQKDSVTTNEFLSGFHKQDRLKPVITMVVYFGAEPWDGPRRLSEMMDFPDERLRRYVKDYEIHLIDPHQMADRDFEKFSTDLGLTFQILKNASDEQSLDRVMKKQENLKISRKAADVLEACAGIQISQEMRGEEVDMCKAWDDHFKSGWQQGREEGKVEGKEEGRLEEAKMIANILFQRNMDIASIAEVVQKSEEQVRAWI